MSKNEINILIDKGCNFTGKMVFSGTARIAGECSGEIVSQDILVIEKGASVDANISVGEVMIFGTAKGKIEARDHVWIADDASFHGDIISPSLKVAETADFQGRSLKPSQNI